MALPNLKKSYLFFDGAMGTALQKKGLKLGEVPELFNFTHPEIVQGIHKAYLEAGANFITTNTFGANRYKFIGAAYSVQDVIAQAVKLVREAKEGYPNTYIALDIGSTGKLLAPVGDVAFEELYEVFKEQAVAGEKAGCDVVLLETFTDLYELKAAILAVKENTKLPIFATMSFESNMRTFFGTGIESMVLTLEALGVAALGVNCSLGPKELLPIVEKLTKIVSIPMLLQPNAGLPIIEKGQTKYNITSDEFANYGAQFAQLGVALLGGCCGTTEKYIHKLVNAVKDIPYRELKNKPLEGICTPSKAIFFDDVRIIGERLNPTGKKLLQQALREQNFDYILKEAIKQQNDGAHILDVNMGLPDIDEVAMLKKAILEVQAIVDLPLQIDSSSIEAIEAGVRIYNGKPIINSVNGKKESLETILPLAKKYGAAVLGLTLDERGIPESAKERLEVATKIVDAALAIGIRKEDIFIDCLVLTASAQQLLVKETIEAVRLVKEKLGVKTVLGVSNVSFGLPNRPLLNKTMLTMALMQGLDAPIMNPADKGMLEAIAAFRVLMGKDIDSETFIKDFGTEVLVQMKEKDLKDEEIDLKSAIIQGLKEKAREATIKLLVEEEPLKVIENQIIPALNQVGEYYEKAQVFLPQLIKSAEAAKSSFEELKKVLIQKECVETPKNTIVLATVFGDIHDIGKNIVKVIMENYNFHIIDLGKDVEPTLIVETVKEHHVKLVGLSALMTTTVESMARTIKGLRQECPWCKVVVGGAVLTQHLAEYVGADYYAKDAMETVKCAQEVFE